MEHLKAEPSYIDEEIPPLFSDTSPMVVSPGGVFIEPHSPTDKLGQTKRFACDKCDYVGNRSDNLRSHRQGIDEIHYSPLNSFFLEIL